MSISQTKVTADEKNRETQNLIPNEMKRDYDTGVYNKNDLKSGKIRIIFAQRKVLPNLIYDDIFVDLIDSRISLNEKNINSLITKILK